MIKSSPKFDKMKCLTCKYRSQAMNLEWPVKVGSKIKYVYCNYLCVTGISTLTKNGDRRGTDYDNCLLYEEGDMITKREKIPLGGSKY